MRLVDLCVLYGIVGIAAGVAIYARAVPRDGRAIASAALAVPLWPLWAPIALSARRPESRLMLAGVPREIEAALTEALEAVDGSPLANLLSRAAVTNILVEVDRAAARCAELDGLLARPELAPDLAAERLAVLEREAAPVRTLASARLHHANVQRLMRLRERDRQALAELTDLVAALRTQLVLARYAGSSAEGVGGIVSEMWARVEGLGAAIECDESGEWAGVEANPGS